MGLPIGLWPPRPRPAFCRPAPGNPLAPCRPHLGLPARKVCVERGAGLTWCLAPRLSGGMEGRGSGGEDSPVPQRPSVWNGFAGPGLPSSRRRLCLVGGKGHHSILMMAGGQQVDDTLVHSLLPAFPNTPGALGGPPPSLATGGLLAEKALHPSLPSPSISAMAVGGAYWLFGLQDADCCLSS